MDKLLEYCKSRYEEEIGFKFSLVNVFSWLFFAICAYVSSSENGAQLIEGLKNLKVKTLLDMTDGVIPSLNTLELIGAVAFVIIIAWLSRELSEGLFYLFTLKDDFQKLIIDITITYHANKHNEISKRALGIGAKFEIERNQKKIRRIRSLAEAFLAISAATIYSFPFTMTNIAVWLACFFGFVGVTWKSFHYFVSDILPYHVAVRYSSGELTEIRDSHTSSFQK